MADADQKMRLRKFWGAAMFSLGILWGFANIAYIPVAVLTTLHGSSWLEVYVALTGGLLTFPCSIAAFYQRAAASRVLFIGGIVVLIAAILGQRLVTVIATGDANILLLLLPGVMAILLGLFGIITDRKHWPPLRNGAR